jgi:ParB family chromosome partitioning protein
MMKRRALGKGLGSLIPEMPPTSPAEGLRNLDPQAIVPNRYQPRESFDDGEMAALAESIKRDGLLQPILVRPSEGGYEIIAGERRWRAAVMAGLKRIPALVQNVAEDRSLELALVENLQRRDLDPIEEATAFKILSERFGMTQEGISERVGKSRPAIANALRLLRLPSDVQALIKDGALSRGHARALLALEDPLEIRRLADRFLAESMNVRSAEEAARSKGKKRARAAAVDPNVQAAQERLQSRLGTQVRILAGAKGKGRIEIAFGSHDELSRLYDGLMTARF